MLHNKKIIIIVGIALVVVSVIVILNIMKSSNNDTEKTTESEGVIIGVGDNNNDNTGEKVTADDREETTAQEETTEPPRQVIESVDSIAGNWASLAGDTFEFIPARGNEALIYIPSKNIFYKGTYETDNKTYIKVDFWDTADSEHTGVLNFTVVSIGKNSDGRVVLSILDEENNSYRLYPMS